MTTKEKIEDLIKPIIEKEGFKFVGAEIKFEGKRMFLTITIDREAGVNVADCARVSRLVDPLLEKEEIVKQKYYLVVSSPGIK